jgi:hypothetical protein
MALDSVLTEWLAARGERLTRPSLPFSNQGQQLIKRYAPPAPEAERQVREGTLLAMHAALVIPLVAAWGIAAWIASKVGGDSASETVLRAGWALLVGWLAGMTLHLTRYYDAFICRRRCAQRSGADREASDVRAHRWPRRSSDADFLVGLAVGVGVFILGAPT